jgi:hypothetical protein
MNRRVCKLRRLLVITEIQEQPQHQKVVSWSPINDTFPHICIHIFQGYHTKDLELFIKRLCFLFSHVDISNSAVVSAQDMLVIFEVCILVEVIELVKCLLTLLS